MGVTLNPDESIVRLAREGLERTGGYCPKSAIEDMLR